MNKFTPIYKSIYDKEIDKQENFSNPGFKVYKKYPEKPKKLGLRTIKKINTIIT